MAEFDPAQKKPASAADGAAAPSEGDALASGQEGRDETKPQAGEKGWYVVHTYSGYENKVKANLEKRVASMNMEGKIFRVVVPTEEEIEVREGKKKIVKRKIFPGYVMVEMIMSDDSWYVVRNTPGVTGFVGTGAKPLPLSPAEVKSILRQMGIEEPRPRIMFSVGESVKVITGPFQGFIGTVREVQGDKGKLRVTVSMFGRETPLELDFGQIEKLS